MKLKTLTSSFIIISIFLHCGCDQDENINSGEQKKIQQIKLNATDVVNGDEFETTTAFNYHYGNELLQAITTHDLKHIEFEYVGDKIIEKKYFNNLEEIANIDSFFYDSTDKLKVIKRSNREGYVIQELEFFYVGNKILKLIDRVLFPNTVISEYEFEYVASNIVHASLSTQNINYTYSYEYDDEANRQDVSFFIKNLYSSGFYAINGITIPIMLSSSSIKTVRGWDESGTQTFAYEYQHQFSDDCYDVLVIKWYDQNQALLNATNIKFEY